MSLYTALIRDDFLLLPTIIIHGGEEPGIGIAWLCVELGIDW